MKKIYVASKETGTIIEEVKTIEEGKMIIRMYEKEDKEDGDYTEDFYDVVDKDRNSLL